MPRGWPSSADEWIPSGRVSALVGDRHHRSGRLATRSQSARAPKGTDRRGHSGRSQTCHRQTAATGPWHSHVRSDGARHRSGNDCDEARASATGSRGPAERRAAGLSVRRRGVTDGRHRTSPLDEDHDAAANGVHGPRRARSEGGMSARLRVVTRATRSQRALQKVQVSRLQSRALRERYVPP
ncbi:MAG: hypothetical protein JWL71_4288 [Acidobacteria bacterium]|nr:hypothetical protein [Acidobacteriota bacterium]